MKKFLGIIFTAVIALMMFAGCESSDQKETIDDSWATNTWEETILFEDIIVEDILVEDIIFEDIIS